MSKKFSKIFKKIYSKKSLQSGSLLKGYVISINKKFIYIDTGLKSLSAVSIEEFKDKKKKLTVKLGDKINVILELVDNGFGITVLSYEKAKQTQEWLFFKNALKHSINLYGIINGRTKGGFNVNLNNIKAFLPGSLVDSKPVKDIKHLEGKKLKFKIIKLDKKRNNIVVSRKAAIKFNYNYKIKKPIKLIKEGINVKGIVKNLTDYGAFIDIGGIDGLLHITDISWKRINHPSDIINIGDEIFLKIIKFDKFNKRVSLGLKQRIIDPWYNIFKRYPKGFITTGRISNLTNYGCFVEIEDGIEGLVHTSEMVWSKKNINLSKLIRINKKIKVMVLNIDIKKRRISLGMKQCKINPWKEFLIIQKKKKYIKGIIKSITDFGIFIGLFGGIDGLIHLTDLSWNLSQKKILNKYYQGHLIKSVILHVDVEHEKVSLGIKQMHKNPFNIFLNKYKKNNFIYGNIILIKQKKIKINLGNNLIIFINIYKIKKLYLLKINKVIKIKFIKIKNNKMLFLLF